MNELESAWFEEGERLSDSEGVAGEDDPVPDLRLRVGPRLWAAAGAVCVLVALVRVLA